jgi:hypothetical protein
VVLLGSHLIMAREACLVTPLGLPAQMDGLDGPVRIEKGRKCGASTVTASRSPAPSDDGPKTIHPPTYEDGDPAVEEVLADLNASQ